MLEVCIQIIGTRRLNFLIFVLAYSREINHLNLFLLGGGSSSTLLKSLGDGSGTGHGSSLEVRALASGDGTGSLDGAAGVLLAKRGSELSVLLADGDGNSAIYFTDINSAVQVSKTRVLEAVLTRPVN
jgi:hypothetical protein